MSSMSRLILEVKTYTSWMKPTKHVQTQVQRPRKLHPCFRDSFRGSKKGKYSENKKHWNRKAHKPAPGERWNFWLVENDQEVILRYCSPLFSFDPNIFMRKIHTFPDTSDDAKTCLEDSQHFSEEVMFDPNVWNMSKPIRRHMWNMHSMYITCVYNVNYTRMELYLQGI